MRWRKGREGGGGGREGDSIQTNLSPICPEASASSSTFTSSTYRPSGGTPSDADYYHCHDASSSYPTPTLVLSVRILAITLPAAGA